MAPELADITCGIAEVDENLARGHLDQAETVIFLDERINLTARRKALAKAAEEAKAHAEAKTREEKNKAKIRQNRAEKAVAKVSTGSSVATVKPVDSRRVVADVLDEVAKEVGYSKRSLTEARYYVNQLGRDKLALVAGTTIGTQAEMKALIKLQTVDPKAVERCMRQTTYAKSVGYGAGGPRGIVVGASPSGSLGEALKVQKAKDTNLAYKSEEGLLAVMYRELAAAAPILNRARSAWSRLPVEKRNAYGWVGESAKNVNAGMVPLTSEVKPQQQKRTGTEYRYKTEAEKPSKQEVRKSLEPHKKAIVAKVKAKQKKRV